MLGAALLFAACSPKASIDCTVAGAPDTPVIVKQLDVNVYKVLDTVRTDASGRMRYSVKVEEGQPEFIYLFKDETRLASLLLSEGEKVVVKADTLGNYEVEGSPESALLAEVERSTGRFSAQMESTDDSKELIAAYLAYYRECTKYVLKNPTSLTVVPVLFQQLDGNTPVFSQYTDAILFRRTLDTLKTVYPDSRYVKALEKETVRRESAMKVHDMIGQAAELGYPEIVLPDINGEKRSLTGVGSRVVLLHFWSSASAADKMFNLDELLPLWKRWHERGLEIYAVDLNPDKSVWASVVKAQKLPWINVNDGLGAASSAVVLYNVSSVPTTYLLSGGELSTPSVKKDALDKELARLLK